MKSTLLPPRLCVVRQQARLTRLYLPFRGLSLRRLSQSPLSSVGCRHHVPSAYKMHLISTFSLYGDTSFFPKSLALTTIDTSDSGGRSNVWELRRLLLPGLMLDLLRNRSLPNSLSSSARAKL